MTILVGGGMGELLSLDLEEHRLVAQAAVAGAQGKMPVVVGVRGGYRLARQMARNVEQSGADAMLLFAPPYGSETAEGAYRYMRDIARSVDIGVLVAMTSGFSGVLEDYWPDLIRRLADLPNIVGFEDSSSDVRIGRALGEQVLERFLWIARGEKHALQALPAGARAYTAAVATLAPNACRGFWKHGIAGNLEAMNEVFRLRIDPLARIRSLRPGYRASAVKVALEAIGRAGGAVRPPEACVIAEDRKRIAEITRKYAEV
jgi:dihydrodipicolinate synthase/N-acetylneuraminate lyase